MEHHNPAWHQLQQTGVQSETTYMDAARKEMYPLFKHAPRKVLDIGCYAGGVGHGLKQSYPGVFVWGCEPNQEIAKIAATRLDKVTQQTTEQWGEAEISLLKEMDTVLFLDVLEHMYNPWGELQFMAKHLLSSAQVLLSIPNVGHMSVMANLARSNWAYEPAGILDVTHIRFFTAYEMRRLIYQTGFRIEEEKILSGGKPQAIEKFPVNLDMGHLKITVRDLAHWQELHAIQFGFRIVIAADDQLTANELELRYGKHR